MRKIFFILLLLTLSVNTYAQNSIKLLAVNEETREGVVVDLSLETIEGSGRILLETYPLSKIDTQISLRFAKMIACQTLNEYCLNKDFVYSIKSSSPVIAGPSAGAAMTLLTMAVLEGKELDENTAITGTINSGGVIGPVGGIAEKIEAAYSSKIKRVLVAKGENKTLDFIDYGEKLGVNVTEISNIEEAYEIFTGKENYEKELVVNSEYLEIMKELNSELCAKTKNLVSEINSSEHSLQKELAINLSKRAEELFAEEKFYSSSSRCFGANVYAREILLGNNLSESEIEKHIDEINKKLAEEELSLNETKIKSLGSLEAAMIVRERIFDAKNNIEGINSSQDGREISYALERIESAKAWKKFMNFSGKEIDESKLKESCAMKINEVHELYNYVSIYYPSLLEETKDELNDAKNYLNTENYALCLFKASKSKAEIDVLLSTLYIGDSDIDTLIFNKQVAAKKAIQKQIEKGNFPILGYSYYEYSDALGDADKYTALLYAEYGIELSNLDIYFPKEKPFEIKIDLRVLLALISGFMIGLLVFAVRKPYKRNKISLRK